MNPKQVMFDKISNAIKECSDVKIYSNEKLIGVGVMVDDDNSLVIPRENQNVIELHNNFTWGPLLTVAKDSDLLIFIEGVLSIID